MMVGLSEVPTAGLKTLLGHAWRADLAFPLTITELTRTGLQYCAIDLLAHLRTLPREGVIAVLTAVVAEREAGSRAVASAELARRAATAAAAVDSDDP